MDLDFSAEDVAFRDEVRTWLDEHKPRDRRPHTGPTMRDWDLAWQRTMWEGGWAGIAWPAEYGGRGLGLIEQLIWYEEYARTGLSSIPATFVGLAHAGPTLIARARDEQKAYHLPRILKGEVVWCQGFSEPEAGSDLGSLRCRADVDGEHLVVTGQKIWTSFADIADWQELLVRTDRDVPKHKGITWVIGDMSLPGIEVRPIRTIDGAAHFAEVFYDEVRIPIANVVGEINDGWSVAMSTLSFERGTAFTASQVQLSAIVEDLIAEARVRTGPDGRRPAIADEEIARRLATARAECASLRALTYLGVSRNQRQSQPGPEGSMLKLMFSDVEARVYRLAMDILDPVDASGDDDGHRWHADYLQSFSTPIAGGTSEIQRNIIGERVLGLPVDGPRETDVDLLLTPDQESIVDAVAAFLEDRLPRERVRELVDDPSKVVAELWGEVAPLGWFGLGLPEEHGGAGLALTDEILLFREIGRRFVPGPFLAAVLGARVAALGGQAELAGRILEGEVVVGLAVAHPEGQAAAGESVSGTFRLLDADGASHVVVVDDDGAALLDVTALTGRTPRRSIDPGTVLELATAEDVAAVAFVAADHDPIGRRGVLLTAALLCGLAEHARDLSVEHARTRVQFGKPIGVNQAIKHKCTDMAVRAESAWAQVCFAALRLQQGSPDLTMQVATAKFVATEAALTNGAETIQVHGGMGFTDEHDSHLLVKRAQVLDHVCGAKRTQLERVLATPPAD